MIGYDNRACTAGLESAIRYTAATDLWEFCNGSAWTAFGGGGGGTIDALTDAYADYTTLNNLIIGRTTAAALTAGAIQNLFIGAGAGATSINSTATTDGNVALGYNALAALTSGNNNVAIGAGVGGAAALQSNTIGTSNVAVGAYTLGTNVAGTDSTAIGHQAMAYANSTTTQAPSYNTALGAYALRGSTTAANNTGTDNTAVGHSALMNNTTGIENTATGVHALYSNTTGSLNTAMGEYALNANIDGGWNTAFGADTLVANTSGTYNTAVGHGALNASVTGQSNTAVGNQALYLSTGHFNTAVGQSALYSTIASSNTAVGEVAGKYITTGGSNTAIGDGAIQSVVGTPLTGSNNTAVGTDALLLLQGAAANNTALGFQAGNSITTGSSNILIGYDVDTPTATTSNHLNIGNTIYGNLSTGNVGIGTTSPGDKLHVYNASATAKTRIETDGTSGGVSAALEIDRGYTGGFAAIDFNNASVDQMSIGLFGGDTNNNLSVWDGSSNIRATFTPAGNVGIGTTTPASSLEIATSSTAYPRGVTSTQYSTDSYGAGYMIRKARGTEAAKTAVVSGDWIGALTAMPYDGSNFLYTGWAGYIVNGTVAANSVPTDFLVTTGATGGGTEKFRITSVGNVGIGTTSPQSALHVPDGKYAQFEDNNAGAPPAGDCDADTERGRMSIDTTNNRLYICNGATRGWDYVALTN